MSRAKALTLTYVLMMATVLTAYGGLTSVGASEGTVVAVIILIGCLAAHIVSRVVMHYPSPEKRGR